jgi:hypothetical protein
MADSAFKSAPFASYTTGELRERIARGSDKSAQMLAELARRDRVSAGDRSVMYPGERLRYVQANPDAPPFSSLGIVPIERRP